MHSALYLGWLRHRRHAPRPHAFRYRVMMAWLDLAELDTVFRGRWLWSARRPALARFDRRDHLGDPAKPLDACVREVMEETSLRVTALSLIGVYDHQRMNQVLIVYHAHAEGEEIRLSPELAEYKLYKPEDIICWPSGTGRGVADWQRKLGIEPRFMDWDERARLNIE